MSRERPKIGIFTEASLDKPGGVQRYAEELYDFLTERGHEVCLITPENLGGRYEPAWLMGKLGTSASLSFTYARGKTIRNFFTSEGIDLTHITSPYGFWGKQVLNEAKKQGVARVATFLVYRDSEAGFLNTLARRFLQKSADSLDHRIALSAAAEKYAQVIAPGEYTLIPGGIDLERFNPDIEGIDDFSNDCKNIFFVGRLDYRKGIEYLLKGYALVKQRFSNARLIIAGRGPEEANLKKLAGELELKDVVFTGYVTPEELPKYYRTAHVACFLSWGDQSFGYVLLEAFASGTPVVAARNPGYEGVMEEAGFGDYLVPVRDHEVLASKISTLLEDEDLRSSYARRCRQVAETQYSWERIGGAILGVYRSALGLESESDRLS